MAPRPVLILFFHFLLKLVVMFTRRYQFFYWTYFLINCAHDHFIWNEYDFIYLFITERLLSHSYITFIEKTHLDSINQQVFGETIFSCEGFSRWKRWKQAHLLIFNLLFILVYFIHYKNYQHLWVFTYLIGSIWHEQN